MDLQFSRSSVSLSSFHFYNKNNNKIKFAFLHLFTRKGCVLNNIFFFTSLVTFSLNWRTKVDCFP